MLFHRPWIIQDARPEIVDTILMLSFGRWLWYHHLHCCPYWQPILWLSINVVALPLDYPGCKTKHCWCSIDAHLEEVVVILSQAFFTRKAANTLSMDLWRCIALGWSMMPEEQWWLLHCCSSLAGVSDIINSIFAYTCGEYFDPWIMSLPTTWIIHVARPKIIDAPLTLILRL